LLVESQGLLQELALDRLQRDRLASHRFATLVYIVSTAWRAMALRLGLGGSANVA
jgi:hypothetical protein